MDVKLCLLLLLLHSAASGPLSSEGDVTHKAFQSEDWELLKEINMDTGEEPVRKYRSKRTGLTVLLGKEESPIVNGQFCVTTEARDNDGLPHTLEHLIFLGSEKYPYKEMLDLTANRCLAHRTNAFTSTDHTCYTVDTAGSDGFLNILPVYMDHILFPNLRDSDFMTEVHHVSAEGEDTGVVYSEMQGTENSASRRLYFASVEELYPGVSSNEVQTGGRMKNLRENTTNEKVREYHRRYYQPRNIYLTITGHVEPEELFKALDPVERSVLSKDPYPEYERPFQTTYPTLTENIDKTILYSSNEEKTGMVSIARRLPYRLWENVPELNALKLLGSYLTSTSVSPFTEAFVNAQSPLAASVEFRMVLFADPGFSVDFGNVPLDKMELIEEELTKTVNKILADGPEKFGLDRMHTLIRRKVLARTRNLENGLHLLLPKPAIMDMVYSHSPDDLSKFLQDDRQEATDWFLAKSAQYWLDLLKNSFAGPRVRILAYPSKALGEEMQKEEKDRVQKQREKMGPEGLKAAGEAIKEAVANQKLPPASVLQSIPVADFNKIMFRKLTYYNYTTEQQPANFDLRSIPFKFHLDDVKSQFLRYYISFDLLHISQQDRPYLTLLNTLWLTSPLLVNGQLQNMTEVIKRRSEDVLLMSSYLGYKGSIFSPGSPSEQMMFYGESMPEKYEAGLKLMRETLFDVQFTVERTQIILSQLLNSLPNVKLSASSVVAAICDNMYYNNTGNVHHASVFRQGRFLAKIQEQLKSDPEAVLAKLKSLSLQVVQPKNAFVYFATDVGAFTGKYGARAAGLLAEFFPANLEFASKDSLKERIRTPAENEFADPNPPFRHVITGIPGSESCQLKQGIRFTSDLEHPDLPAVRVMLQYLTDQMFVKIRGKGLTYGVAMAASVSSGRVQLALSRSSQLIAAYSVFREVVANYTSENQAWEQVLLDSARGSQVHDWVEREETVENLSGTSVTSVLTGATDPFYNRKFAKKLSEVNMDDVRRVARKLLPLFLDPKEAMTAVACGPGEVADAKTAFSKWGYEMEEIKDVENSFLAE